MLLRGVFALLDSLLFLWVFVCLTAAHSAVIVLLSFSRCCLFIWGKREKKNAQTLSHLDVFIMVVVQEKKRHKHPDTCCTFLLFFLMNIITNVLLLFFWGKYKQKKQTLVTVWGFAAGLRSSYTSLHCHLVVADDNTVRLYFHDDDDDEENVVFYWKRGVKTHEDWYINRAVCRKT